MTLKEVIESHVQSWPSGQKTYLVSKEEFKFLLKESGVTPERLNHPNGDGTYYSQLQIEGKSFCHSGRDEISG